MIQRLFILGLILTTTGFADQRAMLIHNMEGRLAYLEGVVASMQGKVEELDKKLMDKLSSNAKGVDVTSPQQPLDTLIPGGIIPERGQALPNTTDMADKSQQLYDAGRKFLNKQAYGEAELAFKELIASYPNSFLNVNAKYWLGEIYLTRSEYDKAAIAFAESYALYQGQPKSGVSTIPSKAADSLLKLAFALRGQGKNEAVCTALEQLKKEFPSIYDAKKTIVDRAKSGLKCSN